MKIQKDNKLRSYIITNKTGELETVLVTSFKGAKQGKVLSLSDGDNKIALSGRQINSIVSLLNKAQRLTNV